MMSPWSLLFHFLCHFILVISVNVQMTLNKNHFNVRLIGYSLHEAVSTSLHECAGNCMKLPGCESFDFQRNLAICKLNNVKSSSVHPSEFVAEQGNLFMDIKEWSKSLQFGCYNHTCSTSQMCLPTGLTHVCRDIDCGIPWITFAEFNKSLTKYGDILVVTCFHRYGILGNDTIRCQANGTWTEIPECVTDCGILTTLHGTATGSSTLLGASQTITCDTGYDLIGSSVVKCLENGTWDDSYCQIKDCSTVFIRHAAVSGDTTVYGSSLRIVCDIGYYLVGHSVVECLDIGVWSNIPLCQLMDCHDPGIPRAIFQSTVTTYGTSVAVSCRDGFILVGPSEIQCLSTGLWSTKPSCYPPGLYDSHHQCHYEVTIDSFLINTQTVGFPYDTAAECLANCYEIHQSISGLFHNAETKGCVCTSDDERFGSMRYLENWMYYTNEYCHFSY